MVCGWLSGVGTSHSVTVPPSVIRPMRLPDHSVNQTFPSGPMVIPSGPVDGEGMGNSVIRLAAWAGEASTADASTAMAVSNATRPSRVNPLPRLMILGTLVRCLEQVNDRTFGMGPV